MVVLDEVDPGEGESIGALRELRRGHAERLEGGAQQRAPGCARELPQARDAVARPAERREQLERPFDARHDDAGLHRDVAEQQVEELRYLAAYHGRIVRDHTAPPSVTERLDRLDPADDARDHVGGEGVRRQLDRLLERDLAGARGGGARVGAVDVVGDTQIHPLILA